MNKETILEAKKIKDFLNEYTVKSTKRIYKIQIAKFFQFLNKNPDTYMKDVRFMDNGQKFKAIDQYEKDMTNYRNYLIKQDYSPKAIHNYMSAAKLVLEHNHVDLDNAFWKKLKKRGKEKVVEPICDFKIPTPEQLKRILTHANTKSRCMFLFQSSAGMRIGEICDLTVNDVELDYEYPHITIRKTKTGVKGRTRCTPEAKETLIEWLRIREDEKDNPDPRLFQCTPKTARGIWNRLLKKAELTDKDKSGKYERNLMGTHCLRRYFRNEFSKYDNDLAAYLMNQRTGLDRKYRDWSDEYLDSEYSKGMINLQVFEREVTDERINDLDVELQKLRTENQDLRNQMQKLMVEVLTMKDKEEK